MDFGEVPLLVVDEKAASSRLMSMRLVSVVGAIYSEGSLVQFTPSRYRARRNEKRN